MEFGLGLARDKFRYDEFSPQLRSVAREVDRKAGKGAEKNDGLVSITETYRALRERDALEIVSSESDLSGLKAEADVLETRSALWREAALWPFAAVAVFGVALIVGGADRIRRLFV